ncbi:MAG: GNAT family N-acetyltransferase [Myxococcota bacterium]
MEIRAAVHADVPAVEALVAPEVRAGRVRPRAVRAEDFLVAADRGRVVGAVALTPLTPDAVELGTLVAAERGRGLGRLLVEAAVARAGALGFGTVVALTGTPAFFGRCGFEATGDTPWLRARRDADLGAVLPMPAPAPVAAASEARSATCAGCALLAGCRQVLLSRRAAVVRRSHA